MQKTGKLILKNLMDEDSDLHLEISVSNGTFWASQDFYVSKKSICDFGKELLSFSGKNDDAVLEYGGDAPKWYCFIKIRAYPFKSNGNSAIEIVVDNHADKPSWGRSEFSIQCVPSDINRLGKLIVDWDFENTSQIEWFVI